MSKAPIIQKLEKKQLKKDIPQFRVGDTISVHTRIREAGKERIQIFTGTVIARKGTGISETFSIHRVAYGRGMERVFLIHSPRIAKIEVVKHGKVRRGKLYYLRGKTGKKARVKGSIGGPRIKLEGEEKKGMEEKVEKMVHEEAQQEQLEQPSQDAAAEAKKTEEQTNKDA